MRIAIALVLPCAAALVPSPYPKGVYDPVAAASYFRTRPLQVAARALEIGWKSAGFAGALLGDALAGDGLEGPNAAERGRALTGLLAELGPTFIKVRLPPPRRRLARACP
jgi:hypothetical protein